MRPGSDPTFHIVWHGGRPYAITAYPTRPTEGHTWHVQIGGAWECVRMRRDGEPQATGWTEIEADVTQWLERRERRATNRG